MFGRSVCVCAREREGAEREEKDEISLVSTSDIFRIL